MPSKYTLINWYFIHLLASGSVLLPCARSDSASCSINRSLKHQSISVCLECNYFSTGTGEDEVLDTHGEVLRKVKKVEKFHKKCLTLCNDNGKLIGHEKNAVPEIMRKIFVKRENWQKSIFHKESHGDSFSTP